MTSGLPWELTIGIGVFLGITAYTIAVPVLLLVLSGIVLLVLAVWRRFVRLWGRLARWSSRS